MRYSGQRELVLNIVKGRYDHPTADVVYIAAREQDSTISLGTVYRNLKVLEQRGQIISIETTDTKLHYDGNIDAHFHFVCNDCGQIYDIQEIYPSIKFIEGVGSVNNAKCVFYGTCINCQSNKNKIKEIK